MTFQPGDEGPFYFTTAVQRKKICQVIADKTTKKKLKKRRINQAFTRKWNTEHWNIKKVARTLQVA
jgi:hypothetical protein